MRKSKNTSTVLVVCGALFLFVGDGRTAKAQGTLVYDQQSATSGRAPGGTSIQLAQPVGQSFTPAAAFVGFAQLQFLDPNQNNGIGSVVFLNLRENSITGNVLATSASVFMPNIFWGTTNFFFPANVAVTPGVQYFLEPVLQSGDDAAVLSDFYNYLGGDSYFFGQPSGIGKDLWFREGYTVPEPSIAWLALTGVSVAFWLRRNQSPTT